uniref:Uncharacterized protein n=1 Tax=Rhipicephalus zambeziensis TaxID=60191 RepID=A0A224YCJ8_9ACAR
MYKVVGLKLDCSTGTQAFVLSDAQSIWSTLCIFHAVLSQGNDKYHFSMPHHIFHGAVIGKRYKEALHETTKASSYDNSTHGNCTHGNRNLTITVAMATRIRATPRQCKKCCLECIAATSKTGLRAQHTTVHIGRRSKLQDTNAASRL